MIETILVDGDLVAHRVAASTENETEDIALARTNIFMERLLYETNAMQHRCFLTGSDNFRYSIYPEYKANRKDMPKPKWLQQVREHLVTTWNATVTDGIEADDAMGIAQCAADGNTCVVSLDKDMLMIPGQHYSWEISGTGSTGKPWTRPAEFRQVSPLDGLRTFYTQLVMGDRSDNIPGYDGKMRQKVPQFLEPHIDLIRAFETEEEMFEHVREMYNDDKRMETSAKCLWIMREQDKIWEWPSFASEAVDGSSA